MQGLRRIFLRNLGIKITSLVLAIAVYAHVYVRGEQEMVMRLPIMLEDLPERLTWRGEVPETVPVRLRARGAELLKLRAQTPRVVISLAQSREGVLQRPLTVGDVVFPPKSDATVLALVEPLALELTIEARASALRPVAVAWRGTPRGGHAIGAGPTSRPESVTVEGPAGLIAILDSVPTASVDLEGRSESFESRIALDVPSGVSCDPPEVVVRVALVPAERREIGPVPIVLPSALRGIWRTDPESALIRLTGPAGIVGELAAREVRLRPTVGARPEDGGVVTLQVVLPPGVRPRMQVEAIEPPTVELVRRKP